ncbi:type II CAAX endopeptidase family protein [Candidatus Contubernalis alkaliaceticus]|uniref:type II CAAX endopeptidase family protein n=1 Tax=Candidatus Contubernalis alkaliaceticus TaxID=338645 RepID=UPI001F4BF941|nr:type II CAAX endopeptidase family protein [Candidatus Contubernalis alkalaceticus]UNC91449.1 CPBP family intramembrane metalloprotease [Candidatus Contubernalis alkalaceticus]
MSWENQNSNSENFAAGEGPAPTTASGIRLILAVMILFVTLGSIAQMIHVEMGMMVIQWVIILPAALMYWRRYKVKPSVFGRLQLFNAGFIPLIFFLALCTWIINIVIAAGLVTFLMEFGFEPIETIAIPTTVRELIIYYVVIVFSAGVCEEVLFRGALMPSIERQGYVPALVFSAFLFALMHMSFLSLIGTFFLGITIGLVVIKTGSLLAGVFYHMLNNFFAVTYLYIYGISNVEATAEPSNLLGLLVFALPAAAGMVICLLKIQKKSIVSPLLNNKEGWFPRGWFSWPMVCIILIFLLAAALEMLMGFGFLSDYVYYSS